MVPSRNFTVRYAAVEATPVAAATADAPDEVTSELNVTQSPLNSRRLSNLVSFFTIRSRPLPPIELGRAGAQPGSLTRPRARLLPPGRRPALLPDHVAAVHRRHSRRAQTQLRLPQRMAA